MKRKEWRKGVDRKHLPMRIPIKELWANDRRTNSAKQILQDGILKKDSGAERKAESEREREGNFEGRTEDVAIGKSLNSICRRRFSYGERREGNDWTGYCSCLRWVYITNSENAGAFSSQRKKNSFCRKFKHIVRQSEKGFWSGFRVDRGKMAYR